MDVIHGPAEGYSGVTDAASYRSVHADALRGRDVQPYDDDTPRDAYINHGRWVMDCVCNGAGLTSLALGISCCFDCGRVFTAIRFPRNAKRIEGLLLARPALDSRNWRDESLAILRDENAQKGVA